MLFAQTDIKEISNKWSKLRTTYMRRRKRKSAQRSGSGALEDGEEDNYGSDNEEMPCETDAMTFLDPYLTVQRSVSNLVRLHLLAVYSTFYSTYFFLIMCT